MSLFRYRFWAFPSKAYLARHGVLPSYIGAFDRFNSNDDYQRDVDEFDEDFDYWIEDMPIKKELENFVSSLFGFNSRNWDGGILYRDRDIEIPQINIVSINDLFEFDFYVSIFDFLKFREILVKCAFFNLILVDDNGNVMSDFDIKKVFHVFFMSRQMTNIISN